MALRLVAVMHDRFAVHAPSQPLRRFGNALLAGRLSESLSVGLTAFLAGYEVALRNHGLRHAKKKPDQHCQEPQTRRSRLMSVYDHTRLLVHCSLFIALAGVSMRTARRHCWSAHTGGRRVRR